MIIQTLITFCSVWPFGVIHLSMAKIETENDAMEKSSFSGSATIQILMIDDRTWSDNFGWQFVWISKKPLLLPLFEILAMQGWKRKIILNWYQFQLNSYNFWFETKHSVVLEEVCFGKHLALRLSLLHARCSSCIFFFSRESAKPKNIIIHVWKTISQ